MAEWRSTPTPRSLLHWCSHTTCTAHADGRKKKGDDASSWNGTKETTRERRPSTAKLPSVSHCLVRTQQQLVLLLLLLCMPFTGSGTTTSPTIITITVTISSVVNGLFNHP